MLGRIYATNANGAIRILSVISACRAARMTTATVAASSAPTSAGVSKVSDALTPSFAAIVAPRIPPPARTTLVNLLQPRSVPTLS